MEVSIDELLTVTKQILDRLKEAGYDKVAVEHDYYWNIPTDERYKVEQQPSTLTIGQLDDDVRELRRIISGEKEAFGYALVWLSAVLRAVGEKAIA